MQVDSFGWFMKAPQSIIRYFAKPLCYYTHKGAMGIEFAVYSQTMGVENEK